MKKIKDLLRSILLFLIFTNSFRTYSQVLFERIVIDSDRPMDPWAKATGDIERDGIPDIVARNQREWGKDGNILHYYE